MEGSEMEIEDVVKLHALANQLLGARLAHMMDNNDDESSPGVYVFHSTLAATALKNNISLFFSGLSVTVLMYFFFLFYRLFRSLFRVSALMRCSH